PPLVAEAVADLSAERPDIVVATSTRVPRGEATPTYSGAGGGAELATRGVLSCGYLRSAQARVLLTALLSLVDADRSADEGADQDAGAAGVRAQWSRYHLYS
ncbi:asparaginase, partial [Dietzia sp. SLG310A2-38A2]|nr:asparaginase [Dietzia sp. SLG310A2-38A2]